MVQYLARYEQQLGMLGAILAVVMFTSLIEIAWNNFQGWSVIWIQPSMTVINNSVWATYGISRGDKFLIIANSAGIFFAIISILAIFV
jgi:hypothetical protein